ncbi:uncharacterized protein F4812DRAFT_451811 [Daldinia caldariorum]|uniref:uncharacterized protein n=1 Tax=Daldinia caldariorum TaxID=326644 RepID=UPI002008DB19|nr:uncharacterized protein F4812DRAFT_451811 [Daldinia caldariorum]KAI1466968.1 hypothetical protein F4812DRAFT_451811 [Daldinia caldariorum]
MSSDQLQPDIYSLPVSPPNFDRVGTFYVAFCATWTFLLFLGMAFLVANRHNPILKVRGIGLTLTAIGFLHVYWILAQITYPIGLTMPIIAAYSVQYFFMGIWFPLGVATFHASNTRFLYVAKMQKRYMGSSGCQKKPGCNGADTSWFCRLGNMDYPTRILIYIGLASIVQVLLTVGMYLACSKYHPSFGIARTGLPDGPLDAQILELGRGWEWWPTALWQVIWTWIIAPIMIWKAWGIRDTLGWRFQTIGCCLSNLHATPLWLISMYVPAFAPVNKYFSSSEWIHLSVTMFEIFTVFVPCWLVVKHHSLRKRAAESNAKWNTTSQTTLRASTTGEWKSASQLEKGLTTIDLLDLEMGDRLFTMNALDHVLNENPGPLQEFSALRDFSGENIAFLTRVAAWKASWPEAASEDQIRDAFTRALIIYTSFISLRDAEFPLNLSSQDLKRLESIFERPARILCGEARVDPATPFAAEDAEKRQGRSGDEWIELSEMAGRIQYAGEISDAFDVTVFDSAQKHIKYLVLTNTWPKFVTEIRDRRPSSESGRSDGTGESNSSLASRISNLISSLF